MTALLSLAGTAAAIAEGRTTSRAVVEACLARIDARNAELGAFVALHRAAALEEADAADRAVAAGAGLGPLHGVPLAHKDMYYQQDRPVTCGSLIRKDWVPGSTATVRQRLADAGAIDLGALAMVEFAMGPHGFNAHLPMSRNPWAADHVPCGSSSGSGIAVAAGFVPASLGSDTGGSVRCPASACGVTGLLPTNGRVSRHGVMPMSFSLDAVGPLARTAQDCALMLQVIAGADPLDPACSTRAVPDYLAGLDAPLTGLRVGIPDSYFDAGISDDVAAALETALAALRDLGAVPVKVAIPSAFEAAADLHPLVMKAEGAANHQAWMRRYPELYTDEVRHRLQAGFFIPASDYIQALKLRAPLLAEFSAAVFGAADVLFTPVLPKAAPSMADVHSRTGAAYLEMVVSLTRNTKPVNYLGLPAISVPCGFTGAGLPVSFQLIGRPFDEATLLRAAHQYQQITDWHRRVPPCR